MLIKRIDMTGTHLTQALAVLILFSWPISARAASFHSESCGYTVEIPDGWSQVPEDVVVRMTASTLKPNVDEILLIDAVFQADGTKPPLTPPFVMFQLVRNEDIGLTRQLYEAEFAETIQKITGRSVQATGEATLNESAKAILDEVEFMPASVDVAARRFRWGFAVEAQRNGKMQAEVRGLFGRAGCALVFFYSLRSEVEQDAGLRDALFSSFRFESGHAYQDDLARPSTIVQTRHPGLLDDRRVLGILALLVFALIAWALRGRNKPMDNSPVK